MPSFVKQEPDWVVYKIFQERFYLHAKLIKVRSTSFG